MGKLKLHEAMVVVLIHCEDKTASTEYVANEIINRDLYKQKDGGDVFPDQIFLRAKNYPKFFEVMDRLTVRMN